MKKFNYIFLFGLLLAAVCNIVPAVPAMASNNTSNNFHLRNEESPVIGAPEEIMELVSSLFPDIFSGISLERRPRRESSNRNEGFTVIIVPLAGRVLELVSSSFPDLLDENFHRIETESEAEDDSGTESDTDVRTDMNTNTGINGDVINSLRTAAGHRNSISSPPIGDDYESNNSNSSEDEESDEIPDLEDGRNITIDSYMASDEETDGNSKKIVKNKSTAKNISKDKTKKNKRIAKKKNAEKTVKRTKIK
ncbi:MAG: MSCRAMM family adhesin SdrC [Rickettsiales bacterium]|jgi:hypothetical protein|nr:MSCRAMM family adhesin SdrC [Rickettsiales bacterium]